MNLRWAVCLTVAWIGVLSSAALAGQPDLIDQEPEIKADFLYKFGNYVEWPADDDAKEFVICVVGESPLVPYLTRAVGRKKIDKRAIAVQHLKSANDFRPCQILFVAAGQDPAQVDELLKKAAQTKTLVVGEDKDFALKQGHIGFYTEQNSVKFEINSGSTEKAGIKISSKLLMLGRIVGPKPE